MTRWPPDEETLRVLSRSTRHGTITALWDGGSVTLPVPAASSFVVGRGSQADVSIDHPSLSRRHVQLALQDGALTVEDLESANGTKVRGRRLGPKQRLKLDWGEAFEIGKVVAMISAPMKLVDALPEAAPRAATMAEVVALVDVVAPTEMAVLLLGETGVGKGFIAERLHHKSARAQGPWLHLNCAALPEHLLESELFGYEKGAFTGATQAKRGLLESATGGTVFLDEIGELPLKTQAKLLLAIEQRQATPLGGVTPRPFDTRFLSATNRTLAELADPARFRQDLFYRLAGMPIVIPPLRERLDELPALVDQFVAKAAVDLGRPAPRVRSASMAALAARPWPGNLRELASALQRAVLFAKDAIEPAHLEPQLAAVAPITSPPSVRPAQLSTSPVPPPQRPSAPPPQLSGPPRSLHEEIRDTERARILEALRRYGGDAAKAADALGLTRRALSYRMDTLGIERPKKS